MVACAPKYVLSKSLFFDSHSFQFFSAEYQPNIALEKYQHGICIDMTRNTKVILRSPENLCAVWLWRPTPCSGHFIGNEAKKNTVPSVVKTKINICM